MIEPLVELFIDVETTSTGLLDVQLEIEQNVKHPGNMTKEETISKWIKEERPKVIKEKIAKTALDPTFGELVSIGWALGPDGSVASSTRTLEHEEANVLRAFFDQEAQPDALPILVGHNVVGFDIPFIWARAAVNGVRVPAWFPPVDVKSWSPQVFDTMLKWPSKRKLRDLCRAFGIDEPRGKGEDVPGLWHEGKFAEIADHCREDVELVRQVWRRLKQVGF